ncbi:MAG: hypothetical protein BV457_05895 [Thermoplasmata archaeon M9B1D]|nr:MAG: hypothetical protein BV457_05895 [Thermoplasmata archaeon M9B1D]PNX51231.1 MAG: hypothetical protein BV456_03990 [Thermoplasmata archaeon M8B2D]
MKFKVTTNAEALQEASGSSYISKSGIYDVTVTFASVDVSKNGAESVNFNLDYNGNAQTIYGPYVTNTDGATNEIGAKLINKLAIIAGMTDGDDFEIEEESHRVGKDKKEVDFAVITNFSDLPIKIRLQEEYYIPEKGAKAGEIQKKMVIKNFFREDGASAEEIINEGEIGKRLALEEEKYASNVTYKNDLTPEDIQAWKDSKKDNTTTTPTPKAKATAKKSSGGSLFK